MKIASLPASEPRMDRFAVTLNGQPAPVSAARVSAVIYNTEWPGHQRPLDQTETAGFVRCESNAPVEVCVTVNEPVTEVCIRPLSKRITVTQQGDTLRFTLPGPGQYVLEPGDHHRALHLFVAPETVMPELGPDDLYFGPGVHETGVIFLRDNQTVYLDAGAVVYGGFIAAGADNVTITGTGILDGSREKRVETVRHILALPWGEDDNTLTAMTDEELRTYVEGPENVAAGNIRFYKCTNCTVEHITCRDSSCWSIKAGGCENMLFDDVKEIGMWRYNSDGIDLVNSRNCIIRNTFLRNFDDCVVLKGMHGWGHRSLENILVENCVIWCDWGRDLEIGAETSALEYRNILFRSCDLLHGSWARLDIQHHNDAYIHDITFEDIRCEYSRHDGPLKFQKDMAVPYEDAPDILVRVPHLMDVVFVNTGHRFGALPCGKKIERILFRNIQVLCDEEVGMPPSNFTGKDEQNCVDGIVIENLTCNGVKLTDPTAANLHCNEFVYNTVIR